MLSAGGVVLGLFGLGKGQVRAHRGRATTLTILHTNDIHGHLTAWQGWEGDLKDKTVGGFGRLPGAIAAADKNEAEKRDKATVPQPVPLAASSLPSAPAAKSAKPVPPPEEEPV